MKTRDLNGNIFCRDTPSLKRHRALSFREVILPATLWEYDERLATLQLFGQLWSKTPPRSGEGRLSWGPPSAAHGLGPGASPSDSLCFWKVRPSMLSGLPILGGEV